MAIKTVVFIVCCTFTSHCMAVCHFSTDLTVQPTGVLYSNACHILVGKDLDELDARRDQVAKLTLALSDMTSAEALEKQRADSWLKTSMDLEAAAQHKAELSKFESWIWFSAGAALMYGASRIPR